MSGKKKTLSEAWHELNKETEKYIVDRIGRKTYMRIAGIALSFSLIVFIALSVSMCSGGGSDYESSEPEVEQVLSNDELKGIDDALGGTLSDKYGKLSD